MTVMGTRLLIVASAVLACLHAAGHAAAAAQPGAAKQRLELPGVHVLQRTDRPGNPDISVQTDRLETSYMGAMDPLHTYVPAMKSFSGRIELEKDGTQCFYSVLMAGYFYIEDIQTVRFYQDDKFDVFLSDGQGKLITSGFEVTMFRHQLIVNDTNTYETCIINRGQRKLLSYNSYRFVPPEMSYGEQQMQKLNNFSDFATASVGELEWRVTKVLSYIRAHSEIYRDTSALETANWSIQWKASATLCLQLLSAGLTTLFIRRLFNEPSGKFAMAT